MITGPRAIVGVADGPGVAVTVRPVGRFPESALVAPMGLRDLYLVSTAPRPPLRIGLLLDGYESQRFVARIIEDIAESNFASLELVVLNREVRPRPARRRSLPARLFRLLQDPTARRLLLYDLYLRVDARRFSRDDDPLGPVDCRAALQSVPCIEVEPVTKGFTHRFAPAHLEQIRERRLDVLLRFGFNILRGGILQSARYGVWSFHHDDNDEYRGGPAGFWELHERNAVTGVMLQVLTEELDAGLVLCKSRFATTAGSSLASNRYAPYWGSTHFVIRKLHELHQHGWDHLRMNAETPWPYRGRRATYRRPGNGDMARFIGRALAAAAIHRVRPPQHRLAMRIAAPGGEHGAGGFEWIDGPPGHVYSDPFLISSHGRTWAFFRDSGGPSSGPAIVCAPVLARGGLGPVTKCLERTPDVGYPMVFAHGGDIFMVPGSPAGDTVDLYRATRFPDRWSLETTLHPLRAVTTTVWRADDRWWFFVSVAEPAGHCATLLLFSAALLTGAWIAHPANPLSSDFRTARGAGAVLRIGGRAIRPASADRRPGESGVALREIVALTPEIYRERPIPTWAPGVRDARTYAYGAGIELIEGGALARPAPARPCQGVDETCVASPE